MNMTLFVYIAILILLTGSVFFTEASTPLNDICLPAVRTMGVNGRTFLRYAKMTHNPCQVITVWGALRLKIKIFLHEPSVKEI
jgi:hypothetical protein